MMIRILCNAAVLTLMSLCLLACRNAASPDREVVPSQPEQPKPLKNLIVLIGDGMGPEALGLLNAYAKYAPGSVYLPSRKTALEEVMAESTTGLVYHDAADILVTDSAASASQMAGGKRALIETVGIDEQGEPMTTLLDRAAELGKSTGLVSDTRLTHATPAAFAAHVPSRGMENEIAAQLVEKRVDVMLSGGLRYFLPSHVENLSSALKDRLQNVFGAMVPGTAKRQDERNLIEEAEAAGYTVVFSAAELGRVDHAPKLLGLFALSGMPYKIDAAQNDAAPGLPQMTKAALDSLSQNPSGFFLMVESGIIDWTEHDNDAGALLHEMIRFDQTLRVLHDFVKSRDDTLLLVTADHDTGGFGFSYSRANIPPPAPFPGNTFKESRYAPSANFGSRDVLDKLYAQKMSYATLFRTLDAAQPENASMKTKADLLVRLVRENTSFPITEAEAVRILENEPNDYRLLGHMDLDRPFFPRVDDFEAFYVYGDDVRRSNLARAVATAQNVVWSTGTHTGTPVVLIADGPARFRAEFGGFVHTTQWSRTAFSLLEP